MNTEMIQARVREKLEGWTPRSAWDKGVKAYALDRLEELKPTDEITMKALLHGFKDAKEYAYGGCGLVYDYYIARRLCSPSELRRKKDGTLPPNSRETWLDVEARAVYQAFLKLVRIAKEASQ